MRKVSKNNPLPLYYQIKEILKEMIENEELMPGDAIPPEREICEVQDVSRMTVNKAIIELVNEGLLYREQGKGTFVARPKEKHQLSKLVSFSQELEKKGVKSSTKILSFQLKNATKQVKDKLSLPDNETKVFEIKRIRLSENEPVAIETIWVPYYMFKDLTLKMIDGKSLYNIFKNQYGYTIEIAKQTIEPIALNEYESELLEQPSNALALLFKRSTYLANGTPIEYTNEIYRSDKYKYEVILT